MAKLSWHKKLAQFIKFDFTLRKLKESSWRNSSVCDNIPEYRPTSEILPVAIIGAGVAGMRAAMMLDHLGIPYEIFEASQRHGGRCYTYHFTRKEESGLKHDYFDVGAMRFPQIPAMKSLFTLFEELGITPEGGAEGRLVPFINNAPGNILMYNGVQKRSREVDAHGDHFHDADPDHGTIPNEYITRKFIKLDGQTVYGVYACYAAALEPFAHELVTDMKAGWEQLMKYETFSAKAFFLQVMRYPFDVIQWMEDRLIAGAGLFNKGFTEAVLDYLFFSYVPPPECSENKGVKWWCIDGGTEVLTNAMNKALKTKPHYSHRVTSVSMSNPQDAKTTMKLTIMGHPEFLDREYSHVISTVPLPCLRMIDIGGCGLTHKQHHAIRSLKQTASLKIGIKFKTRWWQHDSRFAKQVGGESCTDRAIRKVVYPSYGLDDAPELPGVLIAAYIWDEDAVQLGSFVQDKVWGEREYAGRKHPDSEALLLEQVYQDLAALHGQTPGWYKAETLDYYAYAWHSNSDTMGAFAYFGPGEFSTLYPSITVPAAHGHFHFAGAAASIKHSWVSGALDSAWRCVHEILVKETSTKCDEFLNKYKGECHGVETISNISELEVLEVVFAKMLDEKEVRRENDDTKAVGVRIG